MSTPQPVTLPSMGPQLTADQMAIKSKTHWVWTPYKDINNMGPLEINSQLGYREQRWTLIRRCTPYPLGNLIKTETDRAAVAETHASGFSLDPVNAPQIEYVKYAQDQAAELGESHGHVGLRVLTPLIGIDEPERVGQIFLTIQPFAYFIHEMAEEFSAKTVAKKIAQSNLPKEDARIAAACAAIMLDGAENPLTGARAKATAEYTALIQSMSDASLGKPGVSEPNEFHVWICEQLNRPVPQRVNRMEGGGGSGADSAALKVLMERDAARERELQELRAQVNAKSEPKTAEAKK